jgi:Flp pilus assembly secretin CpaC
MFMHAKTGFGLALVLAVTLLGTEANAEKPTPAPQKAPTAAPAAPEETLTLKKGEVRTLDMKEAVRVAVGDPKVADIQVLGEKGASSLSITGSTPGETVLLVFMKDGTRKAYKLVVQG